MNEPLLAYVCATCLGTVLAYDRDRWGRVVWVHLDPPHPEAAHPITTVVGRGFIGRIRTASTWEGADDRD